MWVILLVVAAVVAAAFLLLRVVGRGRFPWVQFYAKGKESGFGLHEIHLLRKIAVQTKLENPTSLFWSIKQLDRSIKEIIVKLRARDMTDDEDSNRLLGKLFELRKKVEFDLPKYRLGLKSSREILPRQRVKITLPGSGPFLAMVIENRQKYFALSYPQGPKVPDGFSWKGQQIGVHFWRAEDAGYFMKTRVLNDFLNQKYPIIHVAHSDEVTRAQKRQSIRVKMDQPGWVYPLKSIQEANEMEENTPGLRCRLKDVSEDGAAIMVGGKTKAGLPIKLQFDLASHRVVMCGVVKGVNFDNAKNVSLLHIQAVTPSSRTRNHILTYVYNLFGEQAQVKG
jgi:c-di-GMP-binding flagellar brake protein YcgR